MFRIGTGIFFNKIHSNTIEYLNTLLDFSIRNIKNYTEVAPDCCTKKGYQSMNVLTYLSDSIKKDLTKEYFDIKDLFHLHLIHYHSNGNQIKHNHRNSEKYSFIVYLNDADGDTVLYLKNKKEYKITPKKGKIVYFPGYLDHEGLLSTKNKRIAVGALQPQTFIDQFTGEKFSLNYP